MPAARILIGALIAAFVVCPAHASPLTLTDGQVQPLAKSCADAIMDKAKGLPGKTTLGPYTATASDYARWGGRYPGAESNTLIRTLPMVQATALDGCAPGSAWKSCLARKMAKWEAQPQP
jgi:hypothetical protein